MQDATKSLEDGIETLRREIVERVAALADEGGGDLYRVIRRRLKQQREHLQRDQFVRHLLVDEVRDETRHARA